MAERTSLKLSQGTEIVYQVYIPQKNINPEKIMVSIHGLSRNYDSHFQMNLAFAQRKNYILIVPEYEKNIFDGYNSLGVEAEEIRADLALNEILDDVSKKIDHKIEKIDLLGYSAGGQFVHRYAMLYPEKINNLFVCAPGFYTFLDEKIKYPLGLNTEDYNDLNLKKGIEKFLNLPIYLYVGENDVSREGNFKKETFLDEQQGMTRVERAKNWYKNIRDKREKMDILKKMELELIKDSAHSFEKCMENGLGIKIWGKL